MFRLKTLFAALLLVASTGLATAQTPYAKPVCDPANAAYKTSTAAAGLPVVKTVIAGSSAMWVTLALGAYNQGNGVVGAQKNTHHYISNGNFNLVDTRPKAFSAANPSVNDSGKVWIVWDERTAFVSGTGTVCAPDVWIYMNTDSVVGNRAVFASIGTGSPAGNFGAYIEAPAIVPGKGGSGIAAKLWSPTVANQTDNDLPDQIAGIFTSANEGVLNAPNLVNVGATDIRPEDAFFAITRANSALGGGADSRDGLGYVSAAATGVNKTTPGAAPANCTGVVDAGHPAGQGSTLDDLHGNAILGHELDKALPGGTPSSFNVMAFNITGQDPFTCANLPAFKVIPVGASPIVFIHSNAGGQLANLKDATQQQLGKVFSGGGADASSFGLPAGPIAVFVREALSGTFNTVESTVMRHPSINSKYRNSMETGVDPTAGDNPLNGNGGRFRAIGTGREVAAVLNSPPAFNAVTGLGHGMDGIGFTFFSYGNVASIADNAGYSYITLNGIDPMWHNYVPGTAGINDPGQNPNPGRLPAVANLPGGCAGGASAVPCDESLIWAADTSYNTVGVTTTTFPSYSFPNLRNGAYPAWSVIRLVAAGAFNNANILVNTSQIYAVQATPDYVPFNTVKVGTTVVDPGLQVLRAHYGCTVPTCGLNILGNPNPALNNPERGRDAGGVILPKGDLKINLTQDAVGFVYFQ